MGVAIGEPAGWLQDADEHTRADFARCFGGYRTPDKTAWFATPIAQRIAALLPRRKRNVGTPEKCSKRFWPKRFPDGTAPR